MFAIDNEKPQALGVLIRRETQAPSPKVLQLKPGLTEVDGKLRFDPERSANPPIPTPPTKPLTITISADEINRMLINDVHRRMAELIVQTVRKAFLA